MKKQPIAIGLFSNVRGIEIGAQRAGFYTPFSTDIEKDVKKHFLQNYKEILGERRETFLVSDVCDLSFTHIKKELDDIDVQIEVGDIDCLVGGPPCFGMTMLSGNRSVFNPLNLLMLHMLRIVKEAKPKTVFIEQVPPFLSEQYRPFRNLVFQTMANMSDYNWDVQQLNAQNYGAYQSRERVIIVGVRNDIGLASLPTPQPVDLLKQSAYAVLGAELYRSGQFKQPPNDGKTKVFGTMTGGNSEEIFIDGRWRKLTISERQILTDMTQVDFSALPPTRQRKTMGNMVMPQFAEAIMKHIHYEILMKSHLYNC